MKFIIEMVQIGDNQHHAWPMTSLESSVSLKIYSYHLSVDDSTRFLSLGGLLTYNTSRGGRTNPRAISLVNVSPGWSYISRWNGVRAAWKRCLASQSNEPGQMLFEQWVDRYRERWWESVANVAESRLEEGIWNKCYRKMFWYVRMGVQWRDGPSTVSRPL